METRIAIVGLACRFPDADSPADLWQNVLGQRRAFRRLPAERLRLEDYLAGDIESPDSIYSTRAAVLRDYEFDRVRFRLGGRSFRAADMTHWLALDVADAALADAGFAGGEGLPREETGVVLGNSLTGEFTRAGLMRLRWPYVRRQLRATLRAQGLDDEAIEPLLADFEARYKEPFPEPTEESLAGGLANTIAGRIANHFDLHGGGYTVDGACASSLLAVATACSSLAAGDVSVALAGGVDLSIDPFELVGFARTGALADGEMRVFDQRPTGFIPGEGCGFVVLQRLDDALAEGRRIYAVVRGWGVSSDGKGGLTRPETEGQLLALRRAYRRAGFGPDTVAHFEAHGTGTAVGDVTELTTIDRARRESSARDRAAVGTIKGQIGHTKAAAGVAGLIKATQAVHHQILPPTPGCRDLHDVLVAEGSTLRVLDSPEMWPAASPLRAAASAMGFGGINSHVVIEGPQDLRRAGFVAFERRLAATPQDAELVVLAAFDRAALAAEASRLAALAEKLSLAEMADLGAEMAKRLPDREERRARAAIVARTPEELAHRLALLADRLEAGPGVYFSDEPLGDEPARVGFLFPGQASPAPLAPRAWRRRFEAVDALYERVDLPATGDSVETAVAQPAIVTASLAGLEALDRLGVRAVAATGHSLGELVALYWAGVFDADALVGLARERGRAMSELGASDGAMASLGAGAEEVEALLAEVAESLGDASETSEIGVAGYNGPEQTVIAGRRVAVDRAIDRARERGWRATRLAVSHAFHSPLVAAARPRLEEALAACPFAEPSGATRVASTVTGRWLAEGEDPRPLLADQVTSPVRFVEAVRRVAAEVDVLVEVGPGRVLGGLARDCVDVPVVSTDAGGDGFAGLLETVGALFVAGAAVDVGALFDDRFVRPLEIDREPRFLVNPCETAPLDDGTVAALPATSLPVESMPMASLPEPGSESLAAEIAAKSGSTGDGTPSALGVVRELVARRAELPAESLDVESKFLGDLHMSSIAVGELVTEAALALELPPPVAPTEYANASLRELAEALDTLRETGAADVDADRPPDGVDTWVRAFAVDQVERPARRRRAAASSWRLLEGSTAGGTLVERLPTRADAPVGSVLVLAGTSEDHELDLLVRAGRAVTSSNGPFLVVRAEGAGGGAAAFARTLHLEMDIATTVVTVPADALEADDDLADWCERLGAEIVDRGFSEVRLEADGRRLVPVVRPLARAESTRSPLAEGDVVVVSGGGKGIGAECALDLARRHGARLGLLGRSRPEESEELAKNLERFAAHGVTCHYVAVDVTDAPAVAAAVAEIEQALGPVRGVLHSAGVNRPKLVAALERADLEHTLAPKVDGLDHLLAAVAAAGNNADAGELKLLVAFGSIIGRMGLRGEADYALANARLRRRVERFAAEHPDARSLCVEWSVWEGVGMGAKLADLEGLERQGIRAIPVDAGVAALRHLLDRTPSAEEPSAVLVTGRFGEPPTLEVDRPELPLWRFLESPRVHVPGVELVADVEVSALTDLYLEDHAYQGEPLVPAVVGLEAMAQAALALLGVDAGRAADLRYRRVRFERPVVVPAGESVTLRLAALVRESGEVDVVLRTSKSQFRVDCFRATLALVDPSIVESPADSAAESGEIEAVLPLDPQDLYGGVLFHEGRFRRVRGYRRLRATECLAEIEAEDAGSWFGPLQPATLLLGDPAARDASIHAIQACIPHATVLPVAVESFESGPAVANAGKRRVWATETRRDGRTLVYDLEVRRDDGALVERWRGLSLQVVEEPKALPLVPPLLGPYLERRLGDFLPASGLRVAILHRNGYDRGEGGRRALALALGTETPEIDADRLLRRADGKPLVAGQDLEVSIAHGDELTLAVAGHGRLGCDLEPVRERDAETWGRLLGEHRELLDLVAGETGESIDRVGTRVWTLLECLKKSGHLTGAPLTYHSTTPDGWALFHCGDQLGASVVLPASRAGEVLSVAVLADRDAVH